jgi:hypothetical protein
MPGIFPFYDVKGFTIACILLKFFIWHSLPVPGFSGPFQGMWQLSF